MSQLGLVSGTFLSGDLISPDGPFIFSGILNQSYSTYVALHEASKRSWELKCLLYFQKKTTHDQNVHTDNRAKTPAADILRLGCRHHWAGRGQLVGGPVRPLARQSAGGTPGAEWPAAGGLGCALGCGERAGDRFGRRWIARRQGRVRIYAAVSLKAVLGHFGADPDPRIRTSF